MIDQELTTSISVTIEKRPKHIIESELLALRNVILIARGVDAVRLMDVYSIMTKIARETYGGDFQDLYYNQCGSCASVRNRFSKDSVCGNEQSPAFENTVKQTGGCFFYRGAQ